MSRALSSDHIVLFISYALTWIVVPLYGLFSIYILYSMGIGLVGVGLFGIMYNASSMVGQLTMGYLSDELRSRKYMIILDLTLSAAISLTLYYDVNPQVYEYLSVAMGFLAGGFSTLMLASSAELQYRLGVSIGFVRVGGALGWVIGSLTLPFMILRFSLRYAALAASVILMANIALVYVMLGETYSPKFKARLGLGTWSLFSLYTFLAGLTISSASLYLPPYIYSSGGSIVFLGEVIAAGASAEIPTMLIAGRLFDSSAFFRRYLLIINGLALSLAYTLYIVLPPRYLYMAQVVRGVGYALFIVSTPALLMSLNVERGKGSGAFFSSFTTGSIVGGAFGGVVSSIMGLRGFYLMDSVMLLTASMAANMLLKPAK